MTQEVQPQGASAAVIDEKMRNDLLHNDISTAEGPRLRAYANAYYELGMAEYDNLIVGEADAKLLFISTLAIGGANASMSVVIGVPSSGKSRMIQHFEQVVDGFEPEHIAVIPHKEGLTDAELVGKTSSVERTRTHEGKQETDTFMSKVRSLINVDSLVLKWDEINRTSPTALNAALELLQDGSIVVRRDGKDVVVSVFDAIVAGMNNYGTLYTHHADPALVSRIGYGVEMGLSTEGVLSEGAQATWRSSGRPYSSKPSLKPVISRDNLHALRKAIDYVDIDNQETEFGERATLIIRDDLKEHGINIHDPRLASQMKRMAQWLSMMRKQDKVTKADITDAAQYMLVAKLGVAGSRLASRETPISELSDAILDKIEES